MSEKNEVTPESTTGAKDEQLKKIESLSASISSDLISIRVVGVLVILAAFGSIYVSETTGLHSPFMTPALLVALIGNYLYGSRTSKKQGELVEMKKAFESKFGAIVSAIKPTS
jgi:hypothetical protein